MKKANLFRLSSFLGLLTLGLSVNLALAETQEDTEKKLFSYECPCENSDYVANVKADGYPAAKVLANRYCKRN